jgi:hypothetical protein
MGLLILIPFVGNVRQTHIVQLDKPLQRVAISNVSYQPVILWKLIPCIKLRWHKFIATWRKCATNVLF